ncbi:MAG: hypothetical protein K2X82_15000 [Gemmataceae bacterium]|nr:hypothetical protein [Gemmataceae bacterium]
MAKKPATGGKAARVRTEAVADRTHGDGTTAFGRRVVSGMRAVNAALRADGLAEVGKKLTARRLKRAALPSVPADPAAVVGVRAAVGASQAAFAALLGVSVGAVRGWEKGTKKPSRMAARFLGEIRGDPGYWKRRVAEAVAAGG